MLASANILADFVSPFESIRNHRKWMAENTPSPDTLDDEEIMLRACQIIDLRLQEPEAERILVAAGSKVPEVSAYLDWAATLDCDTLMRRKRDALRGMADYLDRTDPDCYAARRVRLEWINVESMFRDAMKDYESMIIDQKKVCDRKQDKKERSLLLMMRLGLFDHRNTVEMADNPLHYPELWQLEDEVLELYPVASTDTVSDRMELYIRLAVLKNIPQEDLKVRLMLPERENPYDNDTFYDYTGSQLDYLCNSGFYLAQALELSEKIYGYDHPLTMATRYHLLEYRIYNITGDEVNVRDARILDDYMSAYYPRRSLESRLCRLLKANADFRYSGDPGIASDAPDMIEAARISYGDSSLFYLNILSRLAVFDIFTGSDFRQSVDGYQTKCDEIFSDSLARIYWKMFTHMQIIFRDPAEGASRMSELKKSYLQNHDGSILSVRIGEELGRYYKIAALDFNSAKEIYEAVAGDVAELYGKKSSFAYNARFDVFDVTATGTNPEEITYLDKIINDAEKGEYSGKKRIMTRLRSAKANYYYNNDYGKAHELFEILYAGDSGAETLYWRTYDAICRVRLGLDQTETDTLVSGIRKSLSEYGPDNAPPDLLKELATYYNLVNRQPDAVELLELALEAHNDQTNYSFDDEYLAISGDLARLYDATGNRPAASRLIANDRAIMSGKSSFAPSVGLANYLLEGYYRALGSQDWGAATFYMNGLNKVISDLGASSDGADFIKFTLGIDAIQAYVSLLRTLWDQYESARNMMVTGDYGEFSDRLEEFMGRMSELYPDIKATILDAERNFPGYDPDYQSNPKYLSLLASCSTFYEVCEKDFDKAEEYALRFLKLSEHPIDRKNAYYSLSGLMRHKGDSVRADKYLADAYDIVFGHPEYMGQGERMAALSYLFHSRFTAGDSAEALETARKIYAENRKMLDGNFQFLSSSDQEQIFNTYGDPAWALACMLEKEPLEMAGETYDAIVYRTGMKLRSQQEARRIIARSENPDARFLADSIARIHNQLKQINVTPDQWLSQEATESYNRSSALTFAAHRLEMELLDLTADERSKINPDVTWQMIRDSLKPAQAAVEFLFTHDYVMALLLRHDASAPVAVRLCLWKDLSDGLDALNAKNTASLAKKLYGQNSALDLYSMLWKPLEENLEGVSTIYFNAPGILHSIAFNAIQTPEGDYLIDHYDLRQVTTTAQLTFPSEERAPLSAGLLGDVLFDPSQASGAGKMPEQSGERSVDDDYSLDDFDSRGVSRHYFRYLPFTATELSDISATFGDRPVRTSVRDRATEKEFRELCASSPEVLHLATHGFFLSSDAEAMKVPYMKRFASQTGSAMMRSGIALAGAEATWKGGTDMPEDNDGILTAAEVSAINLKGTRLVALSACESALGSYDFEGVHGLTRGFKQAGVKSLLVSLWSVNDKSTAAFMSAFYRNWIDTGDRHDAYRKAVAAVRSEFPSPFYWAPFILLD